MRMLRQRHGRVATPSPLPEPGVVVVDLEPDMPARAEQRGDRGGVVVRSLQRHHVEIGDLQPVDPGRDDRPRPDDAHPQLVPVPPPPHLEELLETPRVAQHVPLRVAEPLQRRRRVIRPQPDGVAVGVVAGVDRERYGVEPADPVAVEPADRPGLAMVDQHLDPMEGEGLLAQVDAGVGGPVRVRLDDQLVVAVRPLGDEIATPAAPRSVLASDDGAVLDRPHRRMSCGLLVVVVGQQARRHVGDRRSTRPQRAVGARRGEPTGEVPSIEQRDEALVAGTHDCTMPRVARLGDRERAARVCRRPPTSPTAVTPVPLPSGGAM